uniref:Uncharacterized protein n=1 Tax=Rhizophora mucronata TaxID=61149 RepID=A0A2P2IW19_RHIMU
MRKNCSSKSHISAFNGMILLITNEPRMDYPPEYKKSNVTQKSKTNRSLKSPKVQKYSSNQRKPNYNSQL